MSGVGFSELIILFLIGLIVLGPERLPRVANQLGTWLGQARRMTRVMKRQLEEEIDLEGITQNIKQPFEQRTPDDSFPAPRKPAQAAVVEEQISPPTSTSDDGGEDNGEEKKDA